MNIHEEYSVGKNVTEMINETLRYFQTLHILECISIPGELTRKKETCGPND